MMLTVAENVDQHSNSGFPLNFKNEIPRLCSALFPDQSELQVLVLCNFQLAPSPDTPTSFHHHFVITCTECVFSYFSKQKQPWGNVDNTHQFSVAKTINKTAGLSLTKLILWLCRLLETV